MASPHQESYYDMNSINRSPNSHQHQHPHHNQHHNHNQHQHHHAVNRVSSRQFDTYAAPSGLYTADDHARFDTNRYDTARINAVAATYGYDAGAAQTWNPSSFATHTLPPLGGGTGRMKANPRQRSALPTTWIDPPMSSINPLTGLPGLGGSPMRTETVSSDPEDELIPTAIVIKNIPFAVKKEQLVQLMTDLNLPLPYAFNYHFDNGVFRGLAFANFTTPEETGAVIEILNHFDLQGRKLRVEYKKMLPLAERERIEREKRERRGQLEEQHRPIQAANAAAMAAAQHASQPAMLPNIDLNNPQTLQFYSQLLLFRDDHTREALIFPSTLSPSQRRTVHTLAHHMSLAHISRGTGESRQVHIFRGTPNQVQSISPPTISNVTPVEAHQRRTLARATTMDFTETRDSGMYSTMGRQTLLGVPDSPAAREALQNRTNLRAAKSFADLRSYTPSPVPTSASFPVALRENVQRYNNEYANGSVATATPTLTPTATGNNINDQLLANGLAGVSLGGSGLGGIGGGNTIRGDPRDARGFPTMDRDGGGAHGAVGGGLSPQSSNRNFSMGSTAYEDRERGQVLPMRQPRGPDSERSVGFGRPTRPQDHTNNRVNNNRSDMDSQQSGVEIVVE